MGGSNLPDLDAEFSDLPHLRGTLSMARSSDPNSANSQFFICFDDAPHLDRNYTVFGKVTKGMNLLIILREAQVQTDQLTIQTRSLVLNQNNMINVIKKFFF